eukprot:CAMPEP_0172524826 /NCGR_PEP_ID=MMETSP1066-20121228/294394_1 /TAXON_ID=671091 /ORGANISM="Coscinodiscus wailesii, Strain CCMP2513" /LENGTH=706 /DNA_ID=CAMNT_0013307979 /DNA_START=360 /DNA_END=2481 /DNA_ORIENTATION=-
MADHLLHHCPHYPEKKKRKLEKSPIKRLNGKNKPYVKHLLRLLTTQGELNSPPPVAANAMKKEHVIHEPAAEAVLLTKEQCKTTSNMPEATAEKEAEESCNDSGKNKLNYAPTAAATNTLTTAASPHHIRLIHPSAKPPMSLEEQRMSLLKRQQQKFPVKASQLMFPKKTESPSSLQTPVNFEDYNVNGLQEEQQLQDPRIVHKPKLLFSKETGSLPGSQSAILSEAQRMAGLKQEQIIKDPFPLETSQQKSPPTIASSSRSACTMSLEEEQTTALNPDKKLEVPSVFEAEQSICEKETGLFSSVPRAMHLEEQTMAGLSRQQQLKDPSPLETSQLKSLPKIASASRSPALFSSTPYPLSSVRSLVSHQSDRCRPLQPAVHYLLDQLTMCSNHVKFHSHTISTNNSLKIQPAHLSSCKAKKMWKAAIRYCLSSLLSLSALLPGDVKTSSTQISTALEDYEPHHTSVSIKNFRKALMNKFPDHIAVCPHCPIDVKEKIAEWKKESVKANGGRAKFHLTSVFFETLLDNLQVRNNGDTTVTKAEPPYCGIKRPLENGHKMSSVDKQGTPAGDGTAALTKSLSRGNITVAAAASIKKHKISAKPHPQRPVITSNQVVPVPIIFTEDKKKKTKPADSHNNSIMQNGHNKNATNYNNALGTSMKKIPSFPTKDLPILSTIIHVPYNKSTSSSNPKEQQTQGHDFQDHNSQL